MDKLGILLTTVRETFIMLIGGIEDYLGIAYDKSALAKRRQKVRQAGG